MNNTYEPKGIKFQDANYGELLLVQEGWAKDMICYKHPDGQWVTLRKATEEDLKTLEENHIIFRV